VTLTATISPGDGGGTISFTSNSHVIAGRTKKTLNPSGKPREAVCKTTALSVGTDTNDGASE
jgi:hypothetical protein